MARPQPTGLVKISYKVFFCFLFELIYFIPCTVLNIEEAVPRGVRPHIRRK
jgi:hypothetical protein